MPEVDLDNLSLEDMRILMHEAIAGRTGLISYRDRMLMLKKIERKIEEQSEYMNAITGEIRDSIANLNNKRELIRKSLEESLAEEAGSETKTVELPDIGSLTITKEKEKIVIDDEDLVLSQLGDDFVKIVRKLDTVNAKKTIEEIIERDGSFDGVSRVKSRDIRIKFN